MSNKLTFGMYEGKSYEWVFFNAPWYADWIYMNDIHEQPYKFSEDEGRYFRELYRRASYLTGTCPQCQQRPISRLGLSTDSKTCTFAGVGLYCEECEPQGRVSTMYHHPAFSLDGYSPARCHHLAITSMIKNQYIGPGKLTQKRMEEFFRTDAFFTDASPGWFERNAVMD